MQEFQSSGRWRCSATLQPSKSRMKLATASRCAGQASVSSSPVIALRSNN